MSMDKMDKMDKMGVKTGLDVFMESQTTKEIINGRNIGIVGNKNTKSPRTGKHLLDYVLSLNPKKVTLFGPEHGYSSQIEDQEKFENEKVVVDNQDHSKTKIEVFSLFGNYKMPTPESLKGLDLVLFDIQDVGVRFYTFISTLYLTMQACKRDGKKIIILDRPNPLSISQETILGSLNSPFFNGFFAPICLPIRYAMTIGELGNMFNSEDQGAFPSIGLPKEDFEIVKCKNLKRSMYWDDMGIPFNPTSPCMTTFQQTLMYPGTCLFEGTNVNEGRGTDQPFLIFGAPWIKNPIELIKNAENQEMNLLEGVSVTTTSFKPFAKEGVCTHPKYLGDVCYGLKLSIKDKKKIKPLKLTIYILCKLRELYPDDFKVLKFIDKLFGSENLRSYLTAGYDYTTISKKLLENGIDRFKRIRKKYLLYSEE